MCRRFDSGLGHHASFSNKFTNFTIRKVIGKLAAAKEKGLDYLELMLYYSLTAIEENDKIKLEELLKSCLEKEEKVHVMRSLAQHWLKEGIEKDIEKGIEKTAINMLKQDLDPKLIVKITGLSILQIQKLKAALHSVSG